MQSMHVGVMKRMGGEGGQRGNWEPVHTAPEGDGKDFDFHPEPDKQQRVVISNLT